MLLREYNIFVGAIEATRLNWIGMFFNNFLPSGIGGDAYKFVFLNRRYPNRKAAILSSVFIDRGLGLLAVIAVGLGASLFFLNKFSLSSAQLLFYYLSAAGVLISSVLAVVFRKRLSISWKPKAMLAMKIVDAFNTLCAFPKTGPLIIVFVSSFIFVVITALSYSFFFAAFGISVPFLLLLFLIPLIAIAEMAPFTINSLGIREGVGMFLFSYFGIPAAVSLSVLLASRVIGLLLSVTGGVAYLFSRRGGGRG